MLNKKTKITIINKAKPDQLLCPDIRALMAPKIKERNYSNDYSEIQVQMHRRNKSMLHTKCL